MHSQRQTQMIKYISLLALTLFISISPARAQAAVDPITPGSDAANKGEIKLLVPLPGGDANTPVEPGAYIKTIFLYGISLAALFAFAQLVFGAVQYTASAGFPALQESSKSRMKDAIVGLILLVSAVTVLTLFYNPAKEGVKPLEDASTPRTLNTLRADAYEAVQRLTAGGILQTPEGAGTLSGARSDFLTYFMNPRNVHWYDTEQLQAELVQLEGTADSTIVFDTEAQRADYQLMLSYIVTTIKSGQYNKGNEGDMSGGIITVGGTPREYALTPSSVNSVLSHIDSAYVQEDLIK